MPIEAAHSTVERLVARFKGLTAAARRAYNEDNTRKDFILPLFRALEWDTQDSGEVSAEERVSRGWVDFSFRIGGVPRFFLETKRISEDLTKPQWVRQAMDYAWTKGVTWALLSDFEGLRVFNAEWKEDNPLRAQFIEFGVDSYLADFERLWWLSRSEIVAGRLDHEAEKVGKKARREPVSQHLFDDLKTWRQILFKNLHAYNPQWTIGQIDEAVLRILNRLIFIRTAEDRQVEGPRLQALLRELKDQKRSGQLLPELRKLWREFDATYDSQLFEIHRADVLDSASSPFEVLIEGLYGKQYLLYNFNAIDADVLGTAYEQYLGHIISDPDAAEVVEKRAKRKSQGIFYTPTFVVKYIVQQTLGRYLDEYGYNPSRPIRVLDMSCGSGSFLIEAFDVLDRYVAEQRGDLVPRSPLLTMPLLSPGAGEYDVHAHARQMELLTQCIYGVDKDEQAVAVARLNLLLKALHTRDKLPPLEHIRCGDSLISGTADELQAAFGPDWRSKRSFNWQEEFPEAFKDGGFDVIVGNPPWGGDIDRDLAYFHAQYSATTQEHTDSFKLFVERSLRLVQDGGFVSMIVPNTVLRQRRMRDVRSVMLQCEILTIVDLGEEIFRDVIAPSCIFVLRKGQPQDDHQVRLVDLSQLPADGKPGALGSTDSRATTCPQNAFRENADWEFMIPPRKHAVPVVLLGKLTELICKDAGINYQRVSVGMQEKGKSDLADRLLYQGKQQRLEDKMYWKGTDIDRYWIADETSRFCRPDYQQFIQTNEVVHLSQDIYRTAPKILIRQTADHIIAAIDYRGIWFGRSIIAVVTKGHSQHRLEYFLALLNS